MASATALSLPDEVADTHREVMTYLVEALADHEAARADREASRADHEAGRADRELTRASLEAARADMEAARANRSSRRCQPFQGRENCAHLPRRVVGCRGTSKQETVILMKSNVAQLVPTGHFVSAAMCGRKKPTRGIDAWL